jgi:hypothetical protein
VGEVQLDESVAALEEQLADATGMDDRSAARWLIVARTLHRLLRHRGHLPDAARVVAIARETLGIRTEEVVFESHGSLLGFRAPRFTLIGVERMTSSPFSSGSRCRADPPVP